jgi:hypothetical protein
MGLTGAISQLDSFCYWEPCRWLWEWNSLRNDTNMLLQTLCNAFSEYIPWNQISLTLFPLSLTLTSPRKMRCRYCFYKLFTSFLKRESCRSSRTSSLYSAEIPIDYWTEHLVAWPRFVVVVLSNSRCMPCGLKRRSAAARLLGLWVRISPGAWRSLSCEYCVLSGWGLCDGLITPQSSPTGCVCLVVCDLETSKKRRPRPYLGCWATKRNPSECQVNSLWAAITLRSAYLSNIMNG